MKLLREKGYLFFWFFFNCSVLLQNVVWATICSVWGKTCIEKNIVLLWMEKEKCLLMNTFFLHTPLWSWIHLSSDWLKLFIITGSISGTQQNILSNDWTVSRTLWLQKDCLQSLPWYAHMDTLTITWCFSSLYFLFFFLWFVNLFKIWNKDLY